MVIINLDNSLYALDFLYSKLIKSEKNGQNMFASKKFLSRTHE